MNVYQKLQKVRSVLKTIEIKESGNNKFAGYTYMELGDFLPHIVDLCQEHGLCPVVSFGDAATLTVVNSEKPEEMVVFSSPMSTAELKGCHAIQNLGAVETYLRRYLYVAAFDIVEHDALDSTHGKEEKKETKAPNRPVEPPKSPAPTDTPADAITDGQRKMLWAKLKSKNIDEGHFKSHFGIDSLNHLPRASMNDALKFIDEFV